MKVRKKGETIVEVMVAMSILALLFMGIYTMLMSITSVARASRDRTTATALSQKGINLYKRKISDSCSIGIGSLDANNIDTTSYDPPACSDPAKRNDPCNYIEVIKTIPSGSLEYDDLGSERSSFWKIISHVVWKDRNNVSQEIQVSEIVRSK